MIACCRNAAKCLLLLLAIVVLVYLFDAYTEWRMTNALRAGCNAAIDYVELHRERDSLTSDQEIIDVMTAAALKTDPIGMTYWTLSNRFQGENLAPYSPDSETFAYDLNQFNINITRDRSDKIISVSFNEGRKIPPYGFSDYASTHYPCVRFEIETTVSLSDRRGPVTRWASLSPVEVTLAVGIATCIWIRFPKAVKQPPPPALPAYRENRARNTLLMSK